MALLSFAVRLLPWRNAFAGGNILFAQPDAYYHLRRAAIFLKTFPRIPGIDMYMAYPYGAECPWPPLYDLVVAGLTWAVGGGAPSYRALHGVTTFLPPLTAALTVIPIFLLARLLGGTWAGLAAAFIAVLVPGHLAYSVLTSGDHHTAEPLLLVLFLYFFLRAVSPAGEGGRARYALLSGTALGASVLVWQGSIVFAVILVGGVSAWVVLSPFRSDRSELAERGPAVLSATLMSLLTAAVLVSLGRLLYPSETEQTRFNFGFFSWFQPFFLAVLLAGMAAVRAVLPRLVASDRRTVLKGLGAVAGAIAAAGGALFLFPWFRENIADGVRFVLTRNAFLQSISEFQPTFTLATFRRPLFLPLAIEILYLLTFLLPVLLLLRILVRGFRREGERLLEPCLLAFWTVLLLFFAIRQKRWCNAYAVNIAVGVGWTIGAAHEKQRRLQSLGRDFLAWREERRGARPGKGGESWARRLLLSPRVAPVAAVLLASILIIPFYISLYEMALSPPNPITPDLYNSLIWLRENTPPTRTPWNPREKPEYSVFASWDHGHWIQYISERPTVVNNFGYQLRGDGLEDMLRLYFAKDEEAAVAICNKRGIRYLFLGDVFGLMDRLPLLIGIDFPKTYVGGFVPHMPGVEIPFPNEAYMALPYARMYMADSSLTPEGPALSRFRLVFESKNPSPGFYLPPDTKEVKIFEFVKGAVIVGRGAAPGEEVVLTSRLMSNFDRVFEYKNVVKADAAGRFRAVYPYPTTGGYYGMVLLSRGLAYTASRGVFFDIREEDVAGGRTVRVDISGGLRAASHPVPGMRKGPGTLTREGGSR